MKKNKFLLSLSLVSLSLMTACGSSSVDTRDIRTFSQNSKSSYNATYEADSFDGVGYAEESYNIDLSNGYLNTDNNSTNTAKPTDTSRKLIKTYTLSLETELFDQMIGNIEAKLNELGGYEQDLNTYNGSYSDVSRYNRTSSITVRIPVDKLDEFIEFVGDLGNITQKNLSVEDVTLSYVDAESEKKVLKAEEERLLSFLEEAQTIEEILSIESRLSDVKMRLESAESRLRVYDNLIDYATVYLHINEVKKYTEPEPETFGSKVVKSFKDGTAEFVDNIKAIFVWFVGNIFSILAHLAMFTGIYLVIKFLVKRSKKKKALRKQKKAEAMQNKAEEVKASIVNENSDK